MKCFVTGATGHIGCVLVAELVRQGHDVTALIRKTSDISLIDGLGISYAYGDINDEALIEECVSGVDIVFHLAAIIDIASGGYKKMYQTNVVGTKTVAETCLKNKKRLLYMSSVHAIPELKDNRCMTEISSFSPDHIYGNYGKTKAEATECVYSLIDKGLDCVIVHPSGVIGPFDRKPSNLGQFVISCAKGKLPAYIDGMYNFVDVRDVAETTIKAAMSNVSGECFLLTGHNVAVKDLIDMVAEASGKKGPAIKMPYWFALSVSPFFELAAKITKKPPLFTVYSIKTLRSNCNFSSEKASRFFGFAPRPISQTIKDAYEWFFENGFINKP